MKKIKLPPQPPSNVITIKDVWPKRGGTSNIVVIHPKGKDSFPYDDSSERVDQIHNAKYFAQKQIDESNGICISDECDYPAEIVKRVTNIVVNGYIVPTTTIPVPPPVPVKPPMAPLTPLMRPRKKPGQI